MKMFLEKIQKGTEENGIRKGAEKLKNFIESADAVVIGAGSGLSTSAGFTYTGDQFWKYFGDFKDASIERVVFNVFKSEDQKIYQEILE